MNQYDGYSYKLVFSLFGFELWRKQSTPNPPIHEMNPEQRRRSQFDAVNRLEEYGKGFNNGHAYRFGKAKYFYTTNQ